MDSLAGNAMSNRTQQQLAKLLFMAIIVFAGCTPYPKVVGRGEWPLAMAALLEKHPQIANAITTYKHDAFADSKVAWKIVGQMDEVRRLVEELNLQETTSDHVKFKELQESVPESWALPNTKETIFYASDGYGEEHQEGVDLLLLVLDPSQNETFVLYEWVF